jgi:hypothetical protein
MIGKGHYAVKLDPIEADHRAPLRSLVSPPATAGGAEFTSSQRKGLVGTSL